jgi:hypothetical protein
MGYTVTEFPFSGRPLPVTEDLFRFVDLMRASWHQIAS